MRNQTTMLQQVGIPMVIDQLMVGRQTDAIRGIPSARAIEITPDLTCRPSGPSSNSAIIPSTAAREIQTNKSKDSDLFGGPPPKALNQAIVRQKR